MHVRQTVQPFNVSIQADTPTPTQCIVRKPTQRSVTGRAGSKIKKAYGVGGGPRGSDIWRSNGIINDAVAIKMRWKGTPMETRTRIRRLSQTEPSVVCHRRAALSPRFYYWISSECGPSITVSQTIKKRHLAFQDDDERQTRNPHTHPSPHRLLKSPPLCYYSQRCTDVRNRTTSMSMAPWADSGTFTTAAVFGKGRQYLGALKTVAESVAPWWYSNPSSTSW